MDLLVAVKLRNAWFRVWRELGIPLGGGWSTFRGATGVLASLNLKCTRDWRPETGCGLVYSEDPTNDLADMLRLEKRIISRMTQGPGFCPHLKPMLGAAPEEVVARWQMEIFCD